jgi:hypothetical protein
MIKNITVALIVTFFIIFTLTAIILSTLGVETNRFNNLITKKINQSNTNIELKLNKIKFKLDVKEISLFLETTNPLIYYRSIEIPSKNIKVYMDLVSLIKAKPKIKKINLVFNNIKIEELKKLSVTFKPSNFTSFLNNKIKKGKINTKLEIYLDQNNLFDNFIASGSVSNLNGEIIKNIPLVKTNFNFFADKSDVLLKNIFSEVGPIRIKDGDLKANFSSGVSIESNFETNIEYNSKLLKYKNLIKDFKFVENMSEFKADLKNNFIINFDHTYKIKKYNLKSNGKIINANFNFKKPLENFFLNEKIKKFSIINSEIKSNLNSLKKTINISGKYTLNQDKALLFDLENIIDNELLNLKVNVDYKKPLEFELINYKKTNNLASKIFIDFEKKKNISKINEFSLSEGKNLISAKNIIFDKNKFLSLKKISIKTVKDGKKNNDFSIFWGKKIKVEGKHFDASNLPKILSRKKTKNNFSHINKDVEIDFKNIIAPLSESLKNFKLIGKIEKGKLTEISSKGDFGSDNFLDITLKKDKNNQKKYLEVYSDLTRPLLTEYNFFKGLTGGNLLYSSTIEGDNYVSKLKIENFKLINAPGMVKLLSLADLGGLADLAEGEGLSFDIMEINMEKNNELLKINEILALGPSISVLMEGYQNQSVTSLRGTLVPAKGLNKIISKIPVLGDIIIPKEVGEGLFGISFKMKGPPGKIRTTINPIRTITPRFIQKIIEKKKNLNNFN